MAPTNSLLLKSSHLSWDSCPTSFGIGPLNWALDRNSSCSRDNRPNSFGMFPLSGLYPKDKCFQQGKTAEFNGNIATQLIRAKIQEC